VILSQDHSKALSSSITVLKADRYDASFASRVFQATSRMEIITFRTYGPGIEVDMALIVLGCVFGVLVIIHAAGLVTQVGGPQGLRRSFVTAQEIDPDKIGATMDPESRQRRVSRTSEERVEGISCDALGNFCLGILLSLEFCLLMLFLVTHTFVTQAMMLCTLATVLSPMLLAPYLLQLPGVPSSKLVEEEREHPGKSRTWAKRLATWNPQKTQRSRFLKVPMALIFMFLCFVYHVQVLLFYLHKCIKKSRRHVKRCKCRCSCFVNSMIAAVACVSRVLVSPPIYSVLYKTAEKKQEVCGTFAKCLCFCCSLPVWLFIVIDLAMQPEMPSDLVVPSIRGTEVILDSLITCVILLLGRQLALYCTTIPEFEDSEVEIEEEAEVDADCALDGFVVEEVSESKEEVSMQPDPPTNTQPAATSAPSQVLQNEAVRSNALPIASGNAAAVQVSMQPDPPTWNTQPAAAPSQVLQNEAVRSNVLPIASGNAAAVQVSMQPDPPTWNTQPAAPSQAEPVPPWSSSGTSQAAVLPDPPATLPVGNHLNETVLRRLSRISQHFLGAKANSGEWATGSSEVSEVQQSSLLKEKRKKKKKKVQRPLELE